mmetsp:Transcript_98537/g.220016  ORF Transcript_98537/g.220016 Transcript_98537/m.220016 type:complete len:344 (-) Transcript_98537:282-1313(-)
MAGPVRQAGTCGVEHGSMSVPGRCGSGGYGGPVAWEEELSAQVAETLRGVGTSEELLLEEHPRTMDWIRGELLRRGVALEELDRGEAQVAFRGDLDEATDEIDFDIEISRRRPAPPAVKATSGKVPPSVATTGLQRGFLSRGAGAGGDDVSEKGSRTGAARATKDHGSLRAVKAVAAPAAGGCVVAWRDDLAAELAERLKGVPISPFDLRQAQQGIVSEAEALIRLNGLDVDSFSRGELKVDISGDRAALLSGMATLAISPRLPQELTAMLDKDIPRPEEIAKLYEANPAWRIAARTYTWHGAAPEGEQGVPLPSSVIPVTTPDFAVAAGRRLVNIDFISCTS